MTLLGCVLLGIGGTDALRTALRRGAAVAGTALWAVLLAAATLGGAAPWWLLALPAAAGMLWVAAVQVRDRDLSTATAGGRPRTLLLLGAVVLVVASATTAQALAPGGGALGGWTLGPLPGGTVVLGLGLIAFLSVSSNALVRAALNRDATGGAEPHLLAVPQLKGGRWIGPLERIALAGLVLAGAYPVAAGVIAAKGIVRFPEIQKDTEDGTRAEYFLVGSLVSWTLALGAAGLVWISLQ